MQEVASARRLLGALVGAGAVVGAAALYTQAGSLSLGLAPAVVLMLASIPAFALSGVALVRLGVIAPPRTRYPLTLAAPALAYFGAFFLVPLGFLLAFAVATPVGFTGVQYGFDTSNISHALDAIYVHSFLRTLRFATIGTLATFVVGFPFAYWLARHAPRRHRGMLLALVVVPFWTSFLIRTYAFIIILDPSFVLSRVLQDLHVIHGPLHLLYTPTAVQVGIVYNYLPLFVLPVYATLERMDWGLLDAAADLGCTRWAAFRQVTLRLSAPGLLTGMLLVFIPMMGEYVIPAVLGGNKVDLVGSVIGRAFLDQQDYPFGSALAVVVMGALSLFLALYLWLSTRSETVYGA
jgi:spermidine/putrescine transport system permease protein